MIYIGNQLKMLCVNTFENPNALSMKLGLMNLTSLVAISVLIAVLNFGSRMGIRWKVDTEKIVDLKMG